MSVIELRAFGKLLALFKERGWSIPKEQPLETSITGTELLTNLDIPQDQVEVLFINGKAKFPDAIVTPGDRVALVPPGTPGPYRVLLGFVKRAE